MNSRLYSLFSCCDSRNGGGVDVNVVDGGKVETMTLTVTKFLVH
jgi:hypothetical protein